MFIKSKRTRNSAKSGASQLYASKLLHHTNEKQKKKHMHIQLAVNRHFGHLTMVLEESLHS